MVEFRKTAVIGDFTMDTSVALVTNKFLELMSMQVPAQQIRYWGNGAIVNGVDDRGTFKLNPKTSGSADIAGTARLVVSDANKVVRNFRREDRSNDLVDAASGVRLGKDVVGAKEDSYLIIEYKADSAGTATAAQSTVFAPITIRTL